jgi:hypothetical protein
MTQQAASVYPFPETDMVPEADGQGGEGTLLRELATLREQVAGLRQELHEISAIQSPLVGIEQVARYFGKSPDTIRRWVNDRVISCYKIPNNKGHALLFSFKRLESDLEDYEQGRY